MFFSVIIPTRNRCDILAGALNSLRNQTFPADQYELIVVDNGSTDQTRGLVERLNRNGVKQIRYIHEPRPGLHWARHTGAREANGDVLAYTDDDAEVIPEWLDRIAPAYQDPRVAAAGGPINVKWISQPPEWVLPLGTFGHLDLGPKHKELSWPECIFGGNYTVRKQLLFEVGGFNPDTAVEDQLVGDGELGLCKKIYKAGYKIIYVPDALVYHVQKGETVTLQGMKHRFAQQGRCYAYADYKQNQYSLPGLFFKAFLMLVLATMKRLQALIYIHKKPPEYYNHIVLCEARIACVYDYLRLAFSSRFREIVMREDWINLPLDR